MTLTPLTPEEQRLCRAAKVDLDFPRTVAGAWRTKYGTEISEARLADACRNYAAWAVERLRTYRAEQRKSAEAKRAAAIQRRADEQEARSVMLSRERLAALGAQAEAGDPEAIERIELCKSLYRWHGAPAANVQTGRVQTWAEEITDDWRA